MQAFAIAVLALGVANVLMLAVLAARRLVLARRARARESVVERLKPAVLAFLEGEAELPTALTARDRELLADLLGQYGRALRGPALARISVYFEADGTVGNELVRLAGDRSAWRRAAAAYRLGDICAPSAEEALIAALEDDDRDVRTAAVRSLGRLQTPDAVDPLLAAVAGERVPEALVGWALLQIGAPALPRLRGALSAEEPAHRAGAVRLLGLLGDAADADALEACLRDSSAEVRTEAARALGRLGVPRQFPQLVQALDDRVPAVRAAAATALGRLGAPVLEPLLELVRAEQFEVARAAAQAAAALDLPAASAAAGSSPHLAEAVDIARLG